MALYKYIFNPFLKGLDAVTDLTTGDAADAMLYYCSVDLKYYRWGVTIDSEMALPTGTWTHVPVLRMIVDESAVQIVDESGTDITETY